MIAARGLSVAYGAILALEDVTFEVPRGKTVAVLGPNGSGKSTLFSTAVGLLQPVRGEIAVDGRVAYLPQHLVLEPTFPITVLDTVRMGRWGQLGWLRRLGRHDHELVGRAMDRLDIADLADRRLSSLSGGQRQRALLAQAMAQDAEMVLLDEPFTGVDAPTAEAIRVLLREWRGEGRTVLVATHDLDRAATDYDLVLALNRRVTTFGPADECTDAALMATFGGRLATVGSTVVDLDGHHHHHH